MPGSTLSHLFGTSHGRVTVRVSGNCGLHFKMVAQTCSKATPVSTVNVQQPTAAPSQAEYLCVNFVLFDGSNPHKPLCIDVPRSLFDGKAQDCRNIFSDVLLNEFEINTKKTSINFWKVSWNPLLLIESSDVSQPNEHLLLDTATKRGWTERINDIEEFCTPIPLPRPFATALPEIDNVDIVHLIVTAGSLNLPCQINTEGSPSTVTRTHHAHLQDRILEYIISRRDLVGGLHVSDIARAVADPDTNDALQIRYEKVFHNRKLWFSPQPFSVLRWKVYWIAVSFTIRSMSHTFKPATDHDYWCYQRPASPVTGLSSCIMQP